MVLRVVLLAILALGTSAAATDVWDLSGSDGNSGTDNELAHGSEQLHDLQAVGGLADQDWYLVGQQAYSSYEVVVDGLTEEIASIPATSSADPISVQLVNSGGTALATSGAISTIGSGRTLRFRNTTATEITDQYVRVQSAPDGCTTTCSTNAEYRIQLRETTLVAPRFNNSGTQTSILILSNGGSQSASYTIRYWNAAGTLLASTSASLTPHNTDVVNTSLTVPGASGSITIDHTGRYGALFGKLVAVEPATGFTFDTPVLNKPY